MELKIASLIIILVFAILILFINRKRNAWDIMFFNTTLAILALFLIGLLTENTWKEVVYTLGLVSIGSGIAGIFKQRNS